MTVLYCWFLQRPVMWALLEKNTKANFHSCGCKFSLVGFISSFNFFMANFANKMWIRYRTNIIRHYFRQKYILMSTCIKKTTPHKTCVVSVIRAPNNLSWTENAKFTIVYIQCFSKPITVMKYDHLWSLYYQIILDLQNVQVPNFNQPF